MSSRIVDLIEKKRNGISHTRAELESMVLGYARGEVPDYQVAAWLMAVCWRGMTNEEATLLTRVMADSGQVLDLASLGRPAADKHSTGGVGDTTSLVVMPLVAACGVPVGKMSGRGLGFTGGTIDKLDAFPGFRSDLSAAEFVRQLREVGLVITGQSEDLAPADGKLYALRDVTGTVPSVPLIASSVMSKKLAAGARVIVLDVKAGSGAFMRDVPAARGLAEMMVEIGRAAGRTVGAIVSDMSQPLGLAVGNALEVAEALDTLEGRGPAHFRDFCVELASAIVRLASDDTAAHLSVERVLQDGSALRLLRAMVAAQGGNVAAFGDRARLPHASYEDPVPASSGGWLARLDARAVASAAMALGAGRERKGDPVDLAVGVQLHARVGDRVENGAPLATLHANDPARLPRARALFAEAVQISGTLVPAPPLIHARIGLP